MERQHYICLQSLGIFFSIFLVSFNVLLIGVEQLFGLSPRPGLISITTLIGFYFPSLIIAFQIISLLREWKEEAIYLDTLEKLKILFIFTLAVLSASNLIFAQYSTMMKLYGYETYGLNLGLTTYLLVIIGQCPLLFHFED